MAIPLQYNDGDNTVGNQNVAEAVTTDGDIYYNESYIVIGDKLSANIIYATYDLTVIGDVSVNEMTVMGSLLVKGDLNAQKLTCHGDFICSGKARITDLEADSLIYSDSLDGDTVSSSGDVFIRLTLDTNESLDVDGTVVAGEGITGAGTYNAGATIACEYFQFDGDTETSAVVVDGMEIFQATALIPDIPTEEIDIERAIQDLDDTLKKTLKEWSELEEEDFVREISAAADLIPNLNPTSLVVDYIINLSYEKDITNFRDYLFACWAADEFPEELRNYETITPVLSDMLQEAHAHVGEMDFYAPSIREFALSLFILSKYKDTLPISEKDAANKIFSSIGLLYNTVERAWGRH